MSEEQEEPKEQEQPVPEAEEAGRAGGAVAAERVMPVVTAGSAIGAGSLAGLIAGIVQAIWLMIAATATGAPAWGPLKVISTMVLGVGPLQTPAFEAGPVLTGAVVHLVIMVLLGGLFGLILSRIGMGLSVLLGLAYGLILWVLSQYVVWPAIQPDAAAVISRSPWWGPGLSLLVYGLVLGLLYPLFRGRYAER